MLAQLTLLGYFHLVFTVYCSLPKITPAKVEEDYKNTFLSENCQKLCLRSWYSSIPLSSAKPCRMFLMNWWEIEHGIFYQRMILIKVQRKFFGLRSFASLRKKGDGVNAWRRWLVFSCNYSSRKLLLTNN